MPNLRDCFSPPLLLMSILFLVIPETVDHTIYKSRAVTGAEIRATRQATTSTDKSRAVTGAETRATQQAAIPSDNWKRLDLVATAYNSVAAQTDSTPDIAAWGDKLKPGMKSIAVSRDLLKMGLKRGTRVRITGLEGEYIVLDKMNKRWKKRIDIYMGVNIRAALEFGKRDVVLHYKPEKPVLIARND